MGFLRRVHGVILHDKVFSCEMRGTLNFEPLLLDRRSQIRYFWPSLNCNKISYAKSQWQWRNWRGARGRAAPPGKLNVKTGPPSADIWYLVFFWFSVRCCFLRFLGVFAFLASIDIHDIRIHYHFLTFFLVSASGSPYGDKWDPFS